MIWTLVAGTVAGFVLGFLGAGGTVVALPILLFLAGLRPHITLGTNALGVALIAACLLAWRARRHEVPLLEGLIFTLPGLAGIYPGARLGLIYPGQKLVFLLGILLFFVAGWIFYMSTQTMKFPGSGAQSSPADRQPLSWRLKMLRIVPTAVLVGLAAGFFGIGGGFMIVPGLMIAGGLELPLAAAASLLPIAAFSGLVGVEYLAAGSVKMSWSLLMLAAGLVGGGFGIWLSKRLSLRVMQRAFAGFLAALGVYILLR